MSFSDKTLSQYLGGTLPQAEAARIEHAVAAGDEQLETRLRSLDPAAQSVSAAFAALAPSAQAMEQAKQFVDHSAAPHVPSARFPAGRLVAGIALGAGLTLLAGGLWPDFGPGAAQDGSDWRRDVAQYQALYVPETLAQIDQGMSTDVQPLSQTIGLDLSPAATTPELAFKRGQILGFEGAPLIQLAYTNQSGAPVALCIIRNASAPQDLTMSEMEGLQAASWSDGTHAYLLIGGTDADLIARTATDFKARL